MGKWWEFIDYGPLATPRVVKNIQIRQLGIAKVVIVATAKNGGLNR